MDKKKYVVGYDTSQGFVVLRETDSTRAALVMRRLYTQKMQQEIKIKKRLDK